MPRMTLHVALWTALMTAMAVAPVRAQTNSDTPSSGAGTPPAAWAGPAVPGAVPAGVRLAGYPAAPAAVPGYAPRPGVPYTTLPTLPPTSEADWVRRTAWRMHINDLYEEKSHYLGPTGPVYYPPQGYPYLNASLYPAPQPNVPYQVGSTLVTNQAFAPHEYLYPHTYTAMYPPYYYSVKGGWVLTPFGVVSDEKWQLQGTMVKVRYKSHYGPFSLFTPPHGHLDMGMHGIWD